MNFDSEDSAPKKSFFRRVWPKIIADQLAFCFTHTGLTGIILFNWFVVLPKYHQPFTFWYMVHVFSGLYIAFGVFSNLYSMIFIDSTVKSPNLSLPSVLREGWFYCHNCRLNAPPRSHHCPVCDVCVLKRDHHCIFTGNCVGYSNHRHFIWMAFYLWLGCFYTVLFDFDYFSNALGGFSIYTFIKMVFPLAAFILGYCTLYQVGILIVTGICVMAMFLFTCLVSFQIFFISRGQTQFECKKKILDYQRTFKDNWLEVLGKRWYLTPFSYLLKSKLPGDGTHFSKTLSLEPESSHIKNM